MSLTCSRSRTSMFALIIMLALPVRTVTIIESQSQIPGRDTDAEWLAVATAFGHTATIA